MTYLQIWTYQGRVPKYIMKMKMHVEFGIKFLHYTVDQELEVQAPVTKDHTKGTM